MKNVFIRFGLVLAFLVAVFIACEQEQLFDKEDDSLTVDEAKSWFNANQPEFLVLKSGGMSKNTKVIKPSWKGAYASKNRKVEVVETHIMANGAFGFATKDAYDAWLATDNRGYLTSMSRLVVLKYKKTSEMVSFIMTVVGDKPYLEKKKFSQWSNTYLKKDKDFNGLILFHSLEGQFVNGWRYTNGCVSHTVKLNINLPIKLKSGYEDCTTYEMTTWYQDCYSWLQIGELSNGDIVSIDFFEECGDVYSETGYFESCVWVDDGSGGGPGGDYIPPNPCDDCPSICPVCGGCKVGLLKSATTNGDCPMCMCDIINKLDDYPCASQVLNEFSNFNTVISNLLKTVFGDNFTVNITFFADNSLAGTDLDGWAKPTSENAFNIYLNPDVLNNATKEYIAVTYAHEVIHALIDYYKMYDQEKGAELFPIFFDPRNTSSISTSDLAIERKEHETMAQAYIDEMVDVIMQINNSFPVNVAEYLAWGGLQGTWAWDLKKMSFPKDAAGNNIWERNAFIYNNNERNSTNDAIGSPCDE